MAGVNWCLGRRESACNVGREKERGEERGEGAKETGNRVGTGGTIFDRY